MPLAIDEEKFATQTTLDLSKPQGTPQGLPVKQIPHYEFPKIVYLHPRKAYRVVEHRNADHVVVHRENVATEHRAHVCQDQAEFERMERQGYQTEPYIPVAPPSAEDEEIYGVRVPDAEPAIPDAFYQPETPHQPGQKKREGR
jgi:hypothetical protein